jgi:hypothetical protein
MTVTRLNDAILLTGEDVMKVTEVLEHDDESATITFDLSKEEVGVLLEYAIQTILIAAAKERIEEQANASLQP